MSDLAKCVTRPLEAVIGEPLRRVIIRALEGEIVNEEEIRDSDFYVGGEVRLDFETQPIFLSWAQNEGWPDFCSIGVRRESMFAADSTLVDWDFGTLAPWQSCVGKRLVAVRVFAIDETPQVVEFSFAGKGFWVANGHEANIGSETDILIRNGKFPGAEGASLMWQM